MLPFLGVFSVVVAVVTFNISVFRYCVKFSTLVLKIQTPEVYLQSFILPDQTSFIIITPLSNEKKKWLIVLNLHKPSPIMLLTSFIKAKSDQV